MSLLELKDVYYTYKSKWQTVNALNGISASFECGNVYAVIGKSGSGKSTMLSLMAGLDVPTGGDVIFDGKSTKDMRLDDHRANDVSIIYQSFRLFPLLTAVENVMYSMELKGVKAKEAKEKAKELILSVGLNENVFNRYPSMLSGGEQQRVAIARALGMNTNLILADEPTGNLDTQSSETVIEILKSLAHDKGYCVIIVTHDMGILPHTDVVFRMSDGVLTKEEKKEQIFPE